MRDDVWEWDETLYAGAAKYYAAGRMPYPQVVADTMRTELGLDGTGRLLDVGCGPGSLTLLLAPLFESVVGVDADRDMLTNARREAEKSGIDNVTWRHMRAEELPGDLGSFRVVTFAQSFHWIDRPRVAAIVRRMLEPDGAFVHVAATTHEGVPDDGPLLHPRPPRDDIAQLVRRYLGPVRRAGRFALPAGTPDGEADIMRDAGFRGPVVREIGGGSVADRTEDEVVASVFSLSSAAPHLFGDRRAEFERELRDLLRQASPHGHFSERRREVALALWRP